MSVARGPNVTPALVVARRASDMPPDDGRSIGTGAVARGRLQLEISVSRATTVTHYANPNIRLLTVCLLTIPDRLKPVPGPGDAYISSYD